jgi:class 3 adenylate cyclase
MMFTDLKGSTALYDRIGDTEAYVLVREHYAIIGAAVRECDGTVVKTIGDAVMASFLNPADAFRCGVRIQDDFAAYNATSGKEPAIIKLGFHTGRCISVTLNNRLDYYGSAANMAARLQGCSQGGDIVLSMAAASDPAVAPLLAGFEPVVEEAALKGFSHPVAYYRVTAETLTARRARSQPQQRP